MRNERATRHPPRPRDWLYAGVTLVLAVLLLFPVERIALRQAYLSRSPAERAARPSASPGRARRPG
ncbi:hypothetical protein, partial [Nonomuraea sp. NPDC003201]